MRGPYAPLPKHMDLAMLRRILFELKRRNVWRPAAVYAAAAWLVIEVATQVFPLFGVADVFLRGVVMVAVIGFPFWIAFAWLYEFTPEGIKRESELIADSSIRPGTDQRLNRWIVGIMAVTIVLLLTNTLVGRRGVGAGGSSGEDAINAHSIAVLPFADLSPGGDQAYFSDGLTEDLLDLLTRVPALRVAARTSSFAFRDKEVSIDSIASALRVANVLQGSVQRAGDEVRVSVQLVHAADGYQVWSDSWRRTLDDVFTIQEEIARDVAAQLQVKLLGTAVPRVRQTEPRAYALFLQARELGRRFTPEAMLRSDSLYRQVLSIDPRYAPAWSGLGNNYSNEPALGVLSTEEGMRRAREALQKALDIDSTYAPAHASLAFVATSERDFARAAAGLERAFALDPADLKVLGGSTTLLLLLGRPNEAIPLQEYVVRRDPVNVSTLSNLGLFYLWAGRYDDAINRFRTVLNLSPGRAGAHYYSGLALLQKGDVSAALTEIQEEPHEVLRMLGTSMAYHRLGRGAASDSVLVEAVRGYAQDWAYNIAYVYAYRAQADSAFAWLDRAVEFGDPGLVEIPNETLFDPVRSDPRWLPLLRDIGMAPDQLEEIEFEVPVPERDPAAG